MLPFLNRDEDVQAAARPFHTKAHTHAAACTCMQAWADGGYSDDLTVASQCTEQGLTIYCPGYSIFPQWCVRVAAAGRLGSQGLQLGAREGGGVDVDAGFCMGSLIACSPAGSLWHEEVHTPGVCPGLQLGIKGLPVSSRPCLDWCCRIEGSYSPRRYWNYLRRQLYVMDTYANPHNRATNHGLAAFHAFASWGVVLPATTGALHLQQ
jgi:hypothetical protein